jgi:hypothetical protein
MCGQASSSSQAAQESQAGTGPRAKVTNPHGPTVTTCQNCHTYTSWKPIRALPEFNHDQTKYPLRGMHQNVGCTKCHTSLVFTNVSTHCGDCHADIHMRQFGANCENCHTIKGWQVSINDVKNHQNRFPLVGAHATLECAACHKSAAVGQFTGLSTTCYNCHQQDFKTTVIDHTGFPVTCESCHSMDSWFGAKFDHLAVTGFALTGMHATLECTACHINNKFKGTPAACFGCHQADFNGTNDPPHAQAGLPHDCGICHTTVNWLNAKFDHNAYTNYPLTGMHVSVSCAQCHVNNKYVGTPTDCYSCHKADFNSTANPNHAASGFPTNCALCHSTSGWSPSSFDHSRTTFPLTGAHIATSCAQCHVNNNYTTLPTDCYSCHKADYTGANNPNHASAGFPTNCTLCHNTTSWTNATFDHSKTAFPLTGAHISVPCSQCHINNNYTSLPTDCYNCHKADFNRTNNPNHPAAGFPTNCTICHNTSSWNGATFDHSKTPFPLTGAHITVPCSQCHANNVFAGTPTACYSCHQPDFSGTNNPPHVATNLPHDCSLCHTTTNWLNASFNHTLYANYALTGMHATLTCAQCHTNNNYVNTPVDCYSCHKADFTSTTNPNHVTSGFPTDCSICHSTSGWSPSSFDHSKTTFPLTGAHTTVACALCHVNNNYTTLPTACFGCHATDYNNTNNPAHAAAGFPTDCTVCHTTTSWAGAVFDHSKTPFPLTGAHVNVACNLCHINNVFAGTPTDCYSCHKTDYNGTTNPNHTTAGFPTTCATCHTTTSWAGATFNHTWFPTNHGGAKGVCATCHTNSADYSVFTCTNCHGKTDMDQRHSGIKGYVYNSVNCYACHKNGGGG